MTPTQQRVVDLMVHKGFVAAVVQPPSSLFRTDADDCDALATAAQLYLGQQEDGRPAGRASSAPPSAVGTLCRRPRVDCEKGIAVHGSDFGLAMLARGVNPRVSATFLQIPAWWRSAGARCGAVSSEPERLRIEVGGGGAAARQEQSLAGEGGARFSPAGMSSNVQQDDTSVTSRRLDALNRVREISGHVDCSPSGQAAVGAVDVDCLRADGSGFYVVADQLAEKTRLHELGGLKWLAQSAVRGGRAEEPNLTAVVTSDADAEAAAENADRAENDPPKEPISATSSRLKHKHQLEKQRLKRQLARVHRQLRRMKGRSQKDEEALEQSSPTWVGPWPFSTPPATGTHILPPAAVRQQQILHSPSHTQYVHDPHRYAPAPGMPSHMEPAWHPAGAGGHHNGNAAWASVHPAHDTTPNSYAPAPSIPPHIEPPGNGNGGSGWHGGGGSWGPAGAGLGVAGRWDGSGWGNYGALPSTSSPPGRTANNTPAASTGQGGQHQHLAAPKASSAGQPAPPAFHNPAVRQRELEKWRAHTIADEMTNPVSIGSPFARHNPYSPGDTGGGYQVATTATAQEFYPPLSLLRYTRG